MGVLVGERVGVPVGAAVGVAVGATVAGLRQIRHPARWIKLSLTHVISPPAEREVPLPWLLRRVRRLYYAVLLPWLLRPCAVSTMPCCCHGYYGRVLSLQFRPPCDRAPAERSTGTPPTAMREARYHAPTKARAVRGDRQSCGVAGMANARRVPHIY